MHIRPHVSRGRPPIRSWIVDSSKNLPSNRPAARVVAVSLHFAAIIRSCLPLARVQLHEIAIAPRISPPFTPPFKRC